MSTRRTAIVDYEEKLDAIMRDFVYVVLQAKNGMQVMKLSVLKDMLNELAPDDLDSDEEPEALVCLKEWAEELEVESLPSIGWKNPNAE